MTGKTGPRPGKRPRRGAPIGGQIAFGFGVFILVVAALLWGMQTALLGPIYRGVRAAQVRSAADTVERSLLSEGLDDQVRVLSNDMGVYILVTDQLGRMYSGWKPTRREYLLDNLSGRSQLRDLFEQVNLRGGDQMTEYTSPYYYGDGSHPQVLLYLRIASPEPGAYRMILIESEITPVDALVDTLRLQLAWVTGVMVVLGVLLAAFIARKIARPVAAVNESAKELARGNYDVRFARGGTREVNELAQTLDYAAQELTKVESLRRELLANVSHDLRTPLTMIRGYAEVMRDLPGENTPENVQIIIDETQRLTDLVNDLLDLSRLEAGAVGLEPKVFDLTASVRAILARYDKLADYSFPFDAGEEAYVYADELKISQVVYNLVNNAVTYCGADKTVSLRQEMLPGRVRIRVRDTGEGIPQDKLQDIWERYYKVDKEHKRAQVGTGLGLAIVKEILDMHGGAYGVESVLGQGSTFWFELPLAPGGQNGYNGEESGPSGGQAAGGTEQ